MCIAHICSNICLTSWSDNNVSVSGQQLDITFYFTLLWASWVVFSDHGSAEDDRRNHRLGGSQASLNLDD